MYLCQYRDYWNALVNTALNLQVKKATELINIPSSSQRTASLVSMSDYTDHGVAGSIPGTSTNFKMWIRSD